MSGITAELRQQRAALVFGLASLATWLLFESETTKNLVIWVEQARAALMALILLVPLAAITGVWVGGRSRALHMHELEGRALRSQLLVGLRPVLISVLPILSGYLFVVAVRWISALRHLEEGSVEIGMVLFVVPVVTMATVSAWTLLGAAAAKGPIPRWALAPPVGLVAWLHPLLLGAPASEGLAQITWNKWLPQGVWNLTRMGTALALAFALLVFAASLVAVMTDRRPGAVLGVAVAGVVLAAAGGSVASAGPWQSLPERDGLPTLASLHCRSVGVGRVCVHPAHSAVLDEGISDLQRRVADRVANPLVVRLDLGPGLPPTTLDKGVVGMGMEVANGRMRLPEGLTAVLVGARTAT